MIRVGPAGWSYADWEGIVYPRPKPKGFHPLRTIAGLFDAVELNATFYADPSAANAERWLGLVEHHGAFRFTAKLHGDFTHAERPTRTGWDAREAAFRDGLAPLMGPSRLAAVLAQFPASFIRDDRARRRVAAIVERFFDLGVVLELRHRSWFTPSALQELHDLKVGLARIDLPDARDHPPTDEPPPQPTGPTGYLRLHGRNAGAWFDREATRDNRYDYLYEERELDPLVTEARRLAGEHDQLFVVTNNHFEGQAVANGLELQAALNGKQPTVPEGLFARFPRLAAGFQSGGTGRLF